MTEDEKKQTYSELRHVEPFDWKAFLSKKEVTDQEWRAAKELSENWVSCACGNQCAVIPRGPRHRPLDDMLASLGYQFHELIEERNVPDAQQVLGDIEARTAFLLTCPNYTDPLDGSNHE